MITIDFLTCFGPYIDEAVVRMFKIVQMMLSCCNEEGHEENPCPSTSAVSVPRGHADNRPGASPSRDTPVRQRDRYHLLMPAYTIIPCQFRITPFSHYIHAYKH